MTGKRITTALAHLSPSTDEGLTAQAVERHPAAGWSEETREAALEILTTRNVLLYHILTGRSHVPVNLSTNGRGLNA